MDINALVAVLITVGATLLLAVAGAAWRLGGRLGSIERGLTNCESDIREIRGDIKAILSRLPPAVP